MRSPIQLGMFLRRGAISAQRERLVKEVSELLDLPEGPLDLDRLVARTSTLVGADIRVKRVPHDANRPTGLWYTHRHTGRRLLAISDALSPVIFRHVVLHELGHMLVRLRRVSLVTHHQHSSFAPPDALADAVASGDLLLEGCRAYCAEDPEEEALAELLAISTALRAEQYEVMPLPPRIDEMGLAGLIRCLGYED